MIAEGSMRHLFESAFSQIFVAMDSLESVRLCDGGWSRQ